MQSRPHRYSRKRLNGGLNLSDPLRGRIAPRGARPSTGPEKRSAPRAGPRLGGLSRPPRAAASAESEDPSSPLTRRERACVGVGRCLIALDCAPYSFWGGGRRRASLPDRPHRVLVSALPDLRVHTAWLRLPLLTLSLL